MKALIRSFLVRKDVIFSFAGMFIGSLLVYADRMPFWAIIVLVAARELFGFIGMMKNQNGA